MNTSSSVSTSCELTVIIATTCSEIRTESIWRAINSILAAEKTLKIRIIAIVNGTRFDKKLLDSLLKHPKIEVHHQAEANLPLALYNGVSLVKTDFFCFLDDDDEMLPGGLEYRVGVLKSMPEFDAVVTDGVEIEGDIERSSVGQWYHIRIDPIGSLIKKNWLASCGGTYRTERVKKSIWKDLPKYYEWTTVAFRLAKANQIYFSSKQTFLVHSTPQSLSKRPDYILTAPRALELILREVSDREISRHMKKKIASACHTAADFCLTQNRPIDAWKYHIECLVRWGGWRFLPYTRHLLLARNYKRTRT